ncbi:MAG: tetratricopeptide repeat protein [Bacteroidales bacterium]|nr:tetratricopeptide repeat protein [Bacteroidales bacterium]
MDKKYIFVFFLFLVSTTNAQQLPECWYRSQAAFEGGEFNSSLQWLDSCIAKKPKNYTYWVRRGEILFNLSRYNESIESSLKAEKLKLGSSSYILAKAFCMMGDTSSCINWLKTYLGQSEKETEGTIKLSPAFASTSSTKVWKDLWLKDWYSPLEKLVADAKYSIASCQWEETLDLLNPRLKGSKPRPQLLALRAEAYFGLGSFDNAVDDYSIAIKRSKKNHSYLAGRSQAYIKFEKYNSAINDITKAIELSGGKPQYYRIRAEAYHLNKQYQLAFDDISYYISFYPSDSEASFLFATIAVDAGYYVDALFTLGKLIKSNPQKAANYYIRGLAYVKTQNYQLAEIDLNIAIEKNYQLVDSYYYRGISKLNQDKKDDACVDLEEALKHGNFKSQEVIYKYCKKPSTLTKW